MEGERESFTESEGSSGVDIVLGGRQVGGVKDRWECQLES